MNLKNLKKENLNFISSISPNWFFLDTGIHDGIFNMSCDNFLLDSISNNSIKLPLLRVYGWLNPTLSIGANQSTFPFTAGPATFPPEARPRPFRAGRYPPELRHTVEARLPRLYGRLPSDATHSGKDFVDNILVQNLPIVKRVTGGQAVLHGLPEDELTYSVFINYGKVKQLYFEIGEVLLQFLTAYNLKGEFGYSSNSYFKNFDCFNSKTEADIVVNDTKVIGSAQCRKKEYVLQHGSIKLDIVRKLSGKNTDFEQAKVNLKKAFQDKLKIKFIDYTLTGSSNTLCGNNN